MKCLLGKGLFVMKIGQHKGDDGERLAQAHVVCKDKICLKLIIEK
jgi:hypothetical protein